VKKKKSGFIKIPGRGPRPILSERAASPIARGGDGVGDIAKHTLDRLQT